MADYLCPSDIDISIEEKKWLFKCRIEDIDINANNRWKNRDTMYINCLNIDMNQKHLIECPYLLRKDEMVTYIPNITDIYKKEVEEQLYASRILQNNYCRMKAQEDQVNRLNSFVLLYVCSYGCTIKNKVNALTTKDGKKEEKILIYQKYLIGGFCLFKIIFLTLLKN